MQQYSRTQSLAVSLRQYGIPLVIAGIIGSLLLLSLDLSILPYKLEVIRQRDPFSSVTQSTVDFDGDSIRELVICSNENNDGSTSGCVVNRISPSGERAAINQYNVKGRLVENSTQAIRSDYNQDGIEELGMVYHVGDSLFYALFNQDSDRAILNLHIDSVGLDKGKAVMNFKKLGEHDRNGDGYLETYFYLGSHYGLYPRRVYSIDIAQKCFSASPQASEGFKPHKFAPLQTKDQPLFLTGKCQMPDNYEAYLNLPYPDTIGYSYAFNADLSWKAPPAEEVQFPGEVQCFIRNDTLVSICVLPHPDSANQVRYRSLADGRNLGSRKLPWNYQRWHQFGDQFLVTRKDSLFLYNKYINQTGLLIQEGPYPREYELENLWAPQKSGLLCYFKKEKN